MNSVLNKIAKLMGLIKEDKRSSDERQVTCYEIPKKVETQPKVENIKNVDNSIKNLKNAVENLEQKKRNLNNNRADRYDYRSKDFHKKDFRNPPK